MMFGLPRLKTMPALLLAMLLVFVLVMTQTLGVVHGVKHGAAGSLLYAHDHEHAHDHDHDHDHPGGASHAFAESDAQASDHFLEAFFSSHKEASDCRLYDQASHDAPLLAVAPSVLPVAPPPFAVAIFAGEALARWAALFNARGPPLTV